MKVRDVMKIMSSCGPKGLMRLFHLCQSLSWTTVLFFCRYFGIHKPCCWVDKHSRGGQWTLSGDERQRGAVWLCKYHLCFVHAARILVFDPFRFTHLEKFIFREVMKCVCVKSRDFSYVVSFVFRISSQPNVSSGSSLRRTGTTHTPPTSTNTETEGRVTLWH